MWRNVALHTPGLREVHRRLAADLRNDRLLPLKNPRIVGAPAADFPDFSHVKWEAQRGDDFDVIDVSTTTQHDDPTMPAHLDVHSTPPAGVSVPHPAAAGIIPAPHTRGSTGCPPDVSLALQNTAGEAFSGAPPIEFGIEIDCVLGEPMTRATIAHDLTNHSFNHDPHQRAPHAQTRMQFVPTGYSDRTANNWWKVKPDYHHIKSTSGEKVKSFQLVSPVMSTADPAAALHRIATAVAMARDIGARTDPSGGMHLHINVAHLPLDHLKHVVWRLMALEQGLDQLVPMDRLRFGQDELASNRLLVETAGAAAGSTPRAHLNAAANVADLVRCVNPTGRFAKVNMTNFLLRAPHRRDTIEIRSHHAVLDPSAVAAWVGIAARICAPPAPDGAGGVFLDGIDNADTFPATPRQAWRSLDALLAPAPLLRDYARTRRVEIKRLHATYYKNTVAHIASAGAPAIAAAAAALAPGGGPSQRALLSGAPAAGEHAPHTERALVPSRRRGKTLSVVRRRRSRCNASEKRLTQLLSNPDLVSGLMMRQREALVQSGAVIRTEQGAMLSYRHGALKDISPRDAAKREAFPIITGGAIVRSVDSDMSVAESVGGSQAPDSVAPANRHFVPDADPLDPMPVN